MMTSGRMECLLPWALESQRRDLFRDQPDEKHADGKQDQDHRAVRNLAARNHVPDPIDGAGCERERTQREEDPEWTEQRHDLQENEQEARAVMREANLRA